MSWLKERKRIKKKIAKEQNIPINELEWEDGKLCHNGKQLKDCKVVKKRLV